LLYNVILVAALSIFSQTESSNVLNTQTQTQRASMDTGVKHLNVHVYLVTTI